MGTLRAIFDWLRRHLLGNRELNRHLLDMAVTRLFARCRTLAERTKTPFDDKFVVEFEKFVRDNRLIDEVVEEIAGLHGK